MKNPFVKYISGDYDLAAPEECPAVIISEQEIIHLQGRPEEKKMTVAKLLIFLPDGTTATRDNVFAEKVEGKPKKDGSKEVHAHYGQFD